MHLVTLGLIIAFIATSFAQGDATVAQIDGAPKCAQEPLSQAISASKCQNIDVGCLCRSESVVTSIRDGVARSCSPSDKVSALRFLGSLCTSANVDITSWIEGDIISLQSGPSSPSTSRSTATATSSFTPASDVPTIVLTTISGTPAFFTAVSSSTSSSATSGADGGGGGLSQGGKVGIGVGVGVGVPGAAVAIAVLAVLLKRRHRMQKAGDGASTAHHPQLNVGVEEVKPVGITRDGK